MNYLYRKGLIVTTKNGMICKIIARPGQVVYDNKTKFMYVLKEGQYILFNENFRMIEGEYKVAQYHTQPLNGFLANEDHISKSLVYEKTLRRIGIHNSPLYNSDRPEGTIGEIVAFKKLIHPYIRPKLFRINKIMNSNFPLFELSNNEIIEHGTLKMFYRKPIKYEENYFIKKEAFNKKRVESHN